MSKYLVPISLASPPSENEILNILKKISKKIFLVDAVNICQKELRTNVTAGIYLLSLASFKNLIPIEPDSILKAIEKIIPEKYLDLNKKTFELARQKL